jgi:hypothetical protein
MTTIFRQSATCAVCGRTAEATLTGSTNQFGFPDLDFRPPEMMRSTIGSWLQECPSCGYCAESLEEADAGVVAIVRGEAFAAFRSGIADFAQPAKSFHAAAFIAAERLRYAEAFHHTLHEAWAHDDSGDTVRANAARLNAVDLLNQIHREGLRIFEGDGTDAAVAADLLRRAGDFRRSEEVCRAALDEGCSDPNQQVLEFQLKLCSEHDAGGHTMEEVFGDYSGGDD